ncbi:MAG: peptidylprolyl isomerase [Pseudomonadales bacterium]|nr:peptidylprolyl isomerase [Pseudomonadales bacterium]NRA18194.1 peptidylprolyl isomerase [Oceanospirillaceae bacterium]
MINISPESKVELFFEIRLLDGAIVDSNFHGKPAVFKIGDGNMLAGFESALIGLKAGDKQVFSLQPEQAFGMSNPSNMQTINRSKFTGMELETGLVVSFQEPGGELPGVVVSFDETEVVVDFNHPLAGQSLEFQVEIVNVSVD